MSIAFLDSNPGEGKRGAAIRQLALIPVGEIVTGEPSVPLVAEAVGFIVATYRALSEGSRLNEEERGMSSKKGGESLRTAVFASPSDLYDERLFPFICSSTSDGDGDWFGESRDPCSEMTSASCSIARLSGETSRP